MPRPPDPAEYHQNVMTCHDLRILHRPRPWFRRCLAARAGNHRTQVEQVLNITQDNTGTKGPKILIKKERKDIKDSKVYQRVTWCQIVRLSDCQIVIWWAFQVNLYGIGKNRSTSRIESVSADEPRGFLTTLTTRQLLPWLWGFWGAVRSCEMARQLKLPEIAVKPT